VAGDFNDTPEGRPQVGDAIRRYNPNRSRRTRDRDTRQPRGFAFVEMTDTAEAANAINALNGQKLLGRTINVNEARPRPERSGGSKYTQRSNRGGSRW
jgi:RNA recognition motif-containing protein